MTEAQHRDLLGLVKRSRARVMLSGYPSDLYDRELGWRREEIDTAKHSGSGKKKARAREVVWMNS
jgi:DNA adenine methylase